MRKASLLLITFCIIYGCLSQCSTGYYAAPAGRPDANKGACIKCNQFCQTCSGLGVCDSFVDKVTGVDRTASPPSILCGDQASTIFDSSTIGYNKAADSCDNCATGCATCAVDYNLCTSCKAGWDLDKKNYNCIRATLGLTATVLALSVLIILLSVITCICACKLQ